MSTQTPRGGQTFVEKRQGDTLINSIIGAVASVVLSFTGIGIILGGAIAGYLQNQGKGSGAKVGAFSGLLAAIPAFFIISIVFGSIGAFGIGAGAGTGFGAFFGGVAIFVLVVLLVLLVGFGALGGFIGGALADDQRQPVGGGRGRGRGREGRVDESWDEPRDDRRPRDQYDDRGQRDQYDDRDDERERY